MNDKELEIPKLKTFGATICAALMIVFCGQVFAQMDTGSVTGTVKDPSGAVVVAAECALTNVATNCPILRYRLLAGAYTFEEVMAGAYSLRVTAPGFKEYVLKGYPGSRAKHCHCRCVFAIGCNERRGHGDLGCSAAAGAGCV